MGGGAAPLTDNATGEMAPLSTSKLPLVAAPSTVKVTDMAIAGSTWMTQRPAASRVAVPTWSPFSFQAVTTVPAGAALPSIVTPAPSAGEPKKACGGVGGACAKAAVVMASAARAAPITASVRHILFARAIGMAFLSGQRGGAPKDAAPPTNSKL